MSKEKIAIIPSWRVPFESSEKTSFSEIWDENDETYPFVARIIDTTVNANRWAIPETEIDKIIEQIAGTQLRIDHSKNKVREIIGGFTSAKRDGKSIIATGFISDRYVAKLIHDGAVTDFSVSAVPKHSECSVCGKSADNGKNCKCKNAHQIIKDVNLKEVSIVTDGAYDNAKIIPFSASFDEYYEKKSYESKCKISEEIKVSEKDEKEKDENEDYAALKKKYAQVKAELDEYREKLKKGEDEKEKKEDKKEAEDDDDEEEEEEAKKSSIDSLKRENSQLKEALSKVPPPSQGHVNPSDEATGSIDRVTKEWYAWLEEKGYDMREYSAWRGD